MNVIGQIKLNYTEDFKIACKINNLRHEELLQFFIDRVSFYAFIGGDMEAAYLWATNVTVDCIGELENSVAETVKDQKIREISLKYIRMLTSLNLEIDGDKRLVSQRSISIMKEWSLEMFAVTNYLNWVETPFGEKLRLTFDFNLLCSMNGINIDQHLQYFINHISLAKERAVNLFQTPKTDASTALLLLLVSSHEEIKDRILPNQDLYKKYGLWLLKLDRKQREENNLENRIYNYRIFYRDWYNALLKE